APAATDQAVPELEHGLAGVDDRLEKWKGFRDQQHRALTPGAKQFLVFYEVDAAVAPGVAAEEPPGGEDDPSEYAVAPDGGHGVLRAGRMVLAPAREGRRHGALVEADRGDRQRAQRGHADPLARPASTSTERRACSTACSPPRSASSPAAGRATIT